MIKSTTSFINIDKISIPSNFKQNLPEANKLLERYSFYQRTGSFDREILVDEHYNLIDGYTTYLVCKMVGITKIRVLRLKVKLTAHECLETVKAELDGMVALGA